MCHIVYNVRKGYRIVYIIRKVPGIDDHPISAENRKQTRRKPQRMTQENAWQICHENSCETGRETICENSRKLFVTPFSALPKSAQPK